MVTCVIKMDINSRKIIKAYVSKKVMHVQRQLEWILEWESGAKRLNNTEGGKK